MVDTHPAAPCMVDTHLAGPLHGLHTEKKIRVDLTFASSLTGSLSHPGSNICKTQDQSHSDTTLFTGHGGKFHGEKNEYINELYIQDIK